MANEEMASDAPSLAPLLEQSKTWRVFNNFPHHGPELIYAFKGILLHGDACH